MKQETQKKSASKTGSATLEFEDFELHSAMQDFLKDEPKEDGKGVWNFSTFAGLGMLFIALTFLLQLIGFPMGQGLSNFAQDAIGALPIIGGILVTLVGFGFLVGDRKKEKKAKKESRRKRREQKKRNIYSNDIHGAEESTSTLNNDFDSSSKSSRITKNDLAWLVRERSIWNLK